jgi:histidine triad (HIT) family protein
MASVFTRILKGELPGRVVWRDENCAALLSIHPLKPGHTLVIPFEEVDHWLDLEPELASHLFGVSQTIGRALQRAFEPEKVGLMIAGLEVRHVHLHLVPMDDIHDLDFARQDLSPDPKALDRAAEAIRATLLDLGFEKEVAGPPPGAGG